MPRRAPKASAADVTHQALKTCPLVRLVGRTSVDRHAECASIQEQREQLRTWAATHEKTILGEYFDNDTSGAVPIAQRPEGRRLLHDTYASDNDYEQIVVYRADRFGRDQADTATVANELLQRGRLLVSVMEPFDLTTSEGRLIFGNLSVMAQFHKDLIKANANSGRKRAAQQNRWLGGLLPWGMMSPKKHVIVPSDRVIPQLGITEAALVAHLVHEIIRGTSATALARDLNQQGIPVLTYTTQSKPVRQHTAACRSARQRGLLDGPCACPVRIGRWSPQHIATFCHNPIYSGDASLNSEYWGLLPRTCQAIVTKDEQEQAEARLAENKSYRKNMARARDYLLRGLLFCAATRSDGTLCGRRLTGAGGNASGNKHYYVCPHADGKGSVDPHGATCPGTKIAAVWLEDRVWDAALRILAHKEQVIEFVHAQLSVPREDNTAARLAAITTQLQELDAMEATAKFMVLKPGSTLKQDAFEHQLTQFAATRIALRAEQQTLTDRQQDAATQADRLSQANAIPTLLIQAQATLDQLTDHRATHMRRAILETLQVCVNVLPLKVFERRTRSAVTIRFFVKCTQPELIESVNRPEKLLQGSNQEGSMLTVEHVYVSETLQQPPRRPIGERQTVMLQFWKRYYQRYPDGKGAPGGKPRFDDAGSIRLLYEHEAGATIPALAQKYGMDRKQMWRIVCRGLYLRDYHGKEAGEKL